MDNVKNLNIIFFKNLKLYILKNVLGTDIILFQVVKKSLYEELSSVY